MTSWSKKNLDFFLLHLALSLLYTVDCTYSAFRSFGSETKFETRSENSYEKACRKWKYVKPCQINLKYCTVAYTYISGKNINFQSKNVLFKSKIMNILMHKFKVNFSEIVYAISLKLGVLPLGMSTIIQLLRYHARSCCTLENELFLYRNELFLYRNETFCCTLSHWSAWPRPRAINESFLLYVIKVEFLALFWPK